jgi:hypothetical protein
MIQFNPDGSLKLPGNVAEKKDKDINRMKNTRCIHVRKELVSFTSPKKCLLKLKLSDRITDSRFVENTYKYFVENIETPMKFIKINDKEFEIEVGTNFRRCSDCNKLIYQYRDFMDGCVIEDKGSCTFEERSNFSFEDYF